MNFREFKQKCHESKLKKMSGDRLYYAERNFSAVISWFLYKNFKFIRPNHVTVFSFFILAFTFFMPFFCDYSGNYFIFPTQLLLLYFTNILDKVDGELARAKDTHTQRGIYYDRNFHFFYPFVFYFLIGYYFYATGGNFLFFVLTILLSVVSINIIFAEESVSFIKNKIAKEKTAISDLSLMENKKHVNIFFRFFHYLTFMIYGWTLFFYFVLSLVSIYNFDLAYFLYQIHICVTLFYFLWQTFIYIPKYKMIRENDNSI
jgi:phosphatidylglycerophosphate synthase